MKRVEKIWQQLSAQPQEIELAAADNLKYAKGVEIFGKNIDASIDLLEQGKRALEVDMENLREDMRVMSKAMSEVEIAAKELGVNPNEVKGYKEAIDALQYGESQLNKAKKFL
jgi:hypothetical protein